MACREEIKRRMADLENIRRLAKTAAKIEQSIYVILKNNETYSFCKYGEETSDIFEFVHYL